MHALDLRYVDQPGIAADQDRARHFGLRQALVAARHDGARARRQDGPTLKKRLDRRMVLPLLESFIGLVVRVAVVEARDVAERDAVLGEVVQEAAAVSARIGRPAEAVHDLAGRDAAFRHLPQLLDADRIALRVALGVERVLLDQPFGEMPARAFGEHGELGADVDALREARFRRAVLRHAHVADAHADHAVVFDQRFGRGEARIDLHTQRFGLRGEPGAGRAE